jgi:hypothetical protein
MPWLDSLPVFNKAMPDERRRLQLQEASRRYYSTHQDALKDKRRLYYLDQRDAMLKRAREKSHLLKQLYQASHDMRSCLTDD